MYLQNFFPSFIKSHLECPLQASVHGSMICQLDARPSGAGRLVGNHFVWAACGSTCSDDEGNSSFLVFQSHHLKCYSLSRKIVNARENFWNVCFATNQMRDETAKDNRQTAEWINHDLAGNSELTFSPTRNV